MQQHWHPSNPARNLAEDGLPKNGRITDLPEPEPKSGATL